jgi:LCP family protein required for cell wall assembly
VDPYGHAEPEQGYDHLYRPDEPTRRMPQQPQQPAGVLPANPPGYPPQPPVRSPGQAPGQAPARPQRQPQPGGPQGPPDEPPSRRGGGGGGRGDRPRGPVNWKKRILVGLAAFVVFLIVFFTGTYFWASSNIQHEDVLNDYKGRPKASEGTTWLIVGSDSRENMSAADKKKLATGSADGKRTDSMMLLHKGKGGTTLVSLPRDSYVSIPSYKTKKGNTVGGSKNKLNAAYSMGGGELLARTVEMSTGMRLDHYAEVGFDGFVGIVDALGGVDICLKQDIVDKKAGADLKKGCHELNGTEALSFVRARYFDPRADLGRMERQQQFLAAVAKKAKGPSTLLNPFKAFPVADASLNAVRVDDGAGITDLYSLFTSMGGLNGGDGLTTTVPISNPGYKTSVGEAVLWDDAGAKALFQKLRDGEKVTKDN